jgi:pimeloyl-ACP methyl ester carboxylesterase
VEVRFEKVGDVMTRFYTGGEGLPVLLLHGVGMSSDTWMMNIEALSRHHKVYAIDLLGCGFTEDLNTDGKSPQRAMALHVRDFVRHQDLKEFVLVGSSLGSLVAALAYFELQNETKALVFSSGSPLLGEFDERIRKGLEATWNNGRTAFLDTSYAATRKRMENVCYSSTVIPEALIWLQMTSQALPGGLERFDLRLSRLMETGASKMDTTARRLSEIDVPTLLIVGQNDIRDGEEYQSLLLENIPFPAG